MKRFARFWDLVYNSGNFRKSVLYRFKDGKVYDGFFAFSEWIYSQTLSTWQISLDRLAGLLYDYITIKLHVGEEEAKECMIDDINVVKGRKLPKFLRMDNEYKNKERKNPKFNKRQLKHSAQS